MGPVPYSVCLSLLGWCRAAGKIQKLGLKKKKKLLKSKNARSN